MANNGNSRSTGKIRLRDPAPTRAASPNGVEQTAVPLQPLRVSGVVVRKADLIDALRVYVAALADLQVTEDGEHFWLMLDEAAQSETASPT